MTVTCPSCDLENAYSDFADNKGSQYICPDCNHAWIDSSVNEEDEDDDEDDEEFTLPPAAKHVYRIIKRFINEVSSAPETYNISTEEAGILNEMCDVLDEFRNTEVNGSYNFNVQHDRTGNMTYLEISITSDGLRLMHGGYIAGEYGGDSYSDVMFSDEEDNEEVDNDIIHQFVRDMRDDVKRQDVTKIITSSNH